MFWCKKTLQERLGTILFAPRERNRIKAVGPLCLQRHGSREGNPVTKQIHVRINDYTCSL